MQFKQNILIANEVASNVELTYTMQINLLENQMDFKV